jgi:thioredoxin reductase
LPFRQETLSLRLRRINLDSMEADFEALVVGGAAAGLSAALVLGRARVGTLVVDAGEPSNRSAPGIAGLLGQDGTSSAQLYAAGREQLTELRRSSSATAS